MENRKKVDIKLVKTDGSENETLRKIIAKPNINRGVEFSDELSAIQVYKTSLYTSLLFMSFYAYITSIKFTDTIRDVLKILVACIT